MNHTLHSGELATRYARTARTALSALLTAFVALALAMVGDAYGAVAFTAATGTVVSDISETSTPDTHKVRDVSDTLSVLESNRFPFDTMLRRMPNRRRPAHNVKVEFPKTDRTAPRQDTVAASSNGHAGGASVTLSVNNAAMWRGNDVVGVANDLTKPNMVVTSTDVGAGTITVQAVSTTGYGTVPDFVLGDAITRITTSKTERDTPSASRAIMPAYDHNFIHTYDAVVSVSDHRMRTKNYTTTDDWTRARQDNLYDLRKSIEYNNIIGTLSETTGANGHPRWTQNGILRYITQEINYTIGSLSWANLIDINAEVFTGNKGAFTRMLFADSVLSADLDKSFLANERHTPSLKIAGVEFTELRTRHGRLMLAYHPGLDEMGFRSFGFVVDMNEVYKCELQAMERRELMSKRVAGGEDAESEQWIEKSTLEVRRPDAHFIIRGQNA
jgi:hypothetical protein